MTKPQAAVLGSPIAHSLSPILHLAAYRYLGLDWQYRKVELVADQLAEFLDGLDSSWMGLSLTMPLKDVALQLASSASVVATKTNSANTMLFRDGERYVDNTDIAGLLYAIELGRAVDAPIRSATVLGTGATARSAVAAVAELGLELDTAIPVRIAGRTPRNIDLIVDWANREFPVAATGHELHTPDLDLLDSELVISTIPSNPMGLLVSRIPQHPQLMIDVIYDPPTNPFSDAWVAAGGVRVGGLMMLIGQAAEQVQLMTGYTGSLVPIRRAMLEAVAESGVNI